MYIRFNDSNRKYDCTIEKLENDIKVIFENEFEVNSSGFRIYSDAGKLLGSYPKHVVIKESFVDGFLYATLEGGKEEKEAPKTLGERLEEANKKINNLSNELKETKEALDCTNSAIEELLFNYVLKEEETITENE